MKQNLIQHYSIAVISGLIEKAEALSGLNHKLTKGQLRELFIADILKSFLSSQFGIGHGIIINPQGEQSNETDIIIYDNRILPPFIKEHVVAVYPAECVIGTIEIKSVLSEKDILAAEKSAKKLRKIVLSSKACEAINAESRSDIIPLSAIFGYGGKIKKISSQNTKSECWLKDNAHNLIALCIVKEYSWMNVQNKWSITKHDEQTHESIKRFIAVFLDNVRTYAEKRLRLFTEKHRDWLSLYIR